LLGNQLWRKRKSSAKALDTVVSAAANTTMKKSLSAPNDIPEAADLDRYQSRSSGAVRDLRPVCMDPSPNEFFFTGGAGVLAGSTK
jgi:hypothetical protein